MKIPPTLQVAGAGLILALGIAGLIGSGIMADKDRIVVAQLEGKKITRGDLSKYLRDLADEDRPLIQTKQDLLEALDGWINDRVLGKISAQLKKEGKIEASRDLAREKYFEKHPEFRAAYLVEDPAVLEMTKGDLAALKAEVEFGTDEEEERLLRGEALKYRIREAVQGRLVTVTEEEVRAEFERRQHELVRYEYIEFIGLQIPMSISNSIALAAEARRRVDAGEKFDDILRQYAAQSPDFAIPGALQNDPAVERFRSFWEAASGAAIGQIVGPVLMPERDELVRDSATGRATKRTRPAAQMVLEITKSEPERPKTFDEAADELAGAIVRGKVLDQIRGEHGVEVYFDKLPNPAGVGDQYKDSMIDTGKPRSN